MNNAFGEVSNKLCALSSQNVNEEGQRADFDRYIRSIYLTESDVYAVYQSGTWMLIVAFYFMLYRFLYIKRNGLSDHWAIHHRVLAILNSCAEGNFNPFYDAIFSAE